MRKRIEAKSVIPGGTERTISLSCAEYLATSSGSSGRAHRREKHQRGKADRADQQDDDRVDRETGGGDLAVPARSVRDKTAAQHAEGARRQIGAERQIRRRERQAVGAHQRDDRKIGDAAARQAEEDEKDGQREECGGKHRASLRAFRRGTIYTARFTLDGGRLYRWAVLNKKMGFSESSDALGAAEGGQIVVSPDGKFVALFYPDGNFPAKAGTMVFVAGDLKKPAYTIPHAGKVTALAFDGKNQAFTSGSDGTLTRFDAKESPEQRRRRSAVRVLEVIGDRYARALLRDLSRGDPSLALTREAAAALARKVFE